MKPKFPKSFSTVRVGLDCHHDCHWYGVWSVADPAASHSSVTWQGWGCGDLSDLVNYPPVTSPFVRKEPESRLLPIRKALIFTFPLLRIPSVVSTDVRPTAGDKGAGQHHVAGGKEMPSGDPSWQPTNSWLLALLCRLCCPRVSFVITPCWVSGENLTVFSSFLNGLIRRSSEMRLLLCLLGVL